MQSFQDRVVVVTGANGGIGRAIVQGFAAAGARIALLGRRRDALEAVAARAALAPDRHWIEVADLGRADEVDGVARRLGARFGCIGGLVHAAGAYVAGPLAETSAEAFDAVHAVNVRAPFWLTRSLLPALERGGGQVAFLNSSVGLVSRGGLGCYASSKHALTALANSLRDEVNPLGIRVVSLFIGRTASGMQETACRLEGRPYEPDWLLQPDDVADALLHAFALPPSAETTNLHIRPMRKPV